MAHSFLLGRERQRQERAFASPAFSDPPWGSESSSGRQTALAKEARRQSVHSQESSPLTLGKENSKKITGLVPKKTDSQPPQFAPVAPERGRYKSDTEILTLL